MRKTLSLSLLLLVLAIAGITGFYVLLHGQQDDITISQKTLYGNPASAAGLSVTVNATGYGTRWSQRCNWDLAYTLQKNGELKSNVYYSAYNKKIPRKEKKSVFLSAELSSSISAFVQNLPGYLRDLDTAFRDLITKFHLEKYVGDMDSLYAMIDSAMEYAKTIAPEIANIGFQITVSAISGISDALLALVVSAYLLSSKELFIAQVKKATYALFPQKFAGSIILLSRETNDIFGGYISGKLMQSFCLFALNFIAMAIMRLPYAALISAIMGITDIIPFFGPFIGAIPSAILLFLVEPKYALIFVILTIVTQQIDAQIIGPRILGESTGLTAFWVVFAIILGGGLFGVPGMILGIPLFAVLYSVVRQFMNSRLEQQGLSTNSKDYHSPSV